MLSLSLLVSALFSTCMLANAAPIAERIVPVYKCKAAATGPIRTTNGRYLYIDDKDGLLKFGSSSKKLTATFENCQPNFGRYDGKNGTPIGGHVTLKAADGDRTCFTRNNASGKPPFTFGLGECPISDDSSQTSVSFIKQSDGKIYFVGATMADGSYIYYGDQCKSGYYGVKSDGKPGEVAKFYCVNDGHIIGLNI